MKKILLIFIVAFLLILPLVKAQTAEWKLDEGTGTAVSDSIGNNHGTLNNFPVDDSQWVAGVLGNALEFDGVDDYIKVPYDYSLDSIKTISIWFYPHELTKSWYVLLARAPDSGWTAIYELTVTPADIGPLNIDEWYHYVVVYAGTKKLHYINGEKVFSEDHIDPVGSNGDLFIGEKYTPSGKYEWPFKGILDEIQIYDSALSESQVKDLYDSYIAPTCTSNADCSSPTPVCDTSTGECVPCSDTNPCDTGKICDEGIICVLCPQEGDICLRGTECCEGLICDTSTGEPICITPTVDCSAIILCEEYSIDDCNTNPCLDDIDWFDDPNYPCYYSEDTCQICGSITGIADCSLYDNQDTCETYNPCNESLGFGSCEWDSTLGECEEDLSLATSPRCDYYWEGTKWSKCNPETEKRKRTGEYKLENDCPDSCWQDAPPPTPILETPCLVAKKFLFSSPISIIIALVLLTGYYIFMKRQQQPL